MAFKTVHFIVSVIPRLSTFGLTAYLTAGIDGINHGNQSSSHDTANLVTCEEPSKKHPNHEKPQWTGPGHWR